MPPTSVSHRPQTIKQAKKAYRKSGATVRLSASELAVIERRAVLQERADRIKDREARRKANIKKREERNENEREARQRMGIPDPPKEGIHIGPSQLSLGNFMNVGGKRKREEECFEDWQLNKENTVDISLEGYRTPSLPRTPWRNPLKVISPNMPTPKSLPIATQKTGLADLAASKIPQRAPTPPSQVTKPTSLKSIVGQNLPSAESQRPNSGDCKSLKTQSSLMGPPPPPRPSSLQHLKTESKQEPPNPTPQERPPDTIEDSWDDFFASSTQIASELSPISSKSIPPVSLPPRPSAHLPYPAPLPIPPKDDTANLLDHLSTQDLDFSLDLTQAPPRILDSPSADLLLAQICTQDLDFSPDLTQIPLAATPKEESLSSSDFDDEDLTEEDLEDAVQEFERESSTTTGPKSRTTTPAPLHQKIKSEPLLKVKAKIPKPPPDLQPKSIKPDLYDNASSPPNNNGYNSDDAAAVYHDYILGDWAEDIGNDFFDEDGAPCSQDEDSKSEMKDEDEEDFKIEDQEGGDENFDLSTQEWADFAS